MLKNAFIGAVAAIVLPLLAAPAAAQDQKSDHHYSGGPNSYVPHHIGRRVKSETDGSATPSQAGKHHYQGGPQAIHHIGDLPQAKGNTPKTSKVMRKKKKVS